MSQVEDNESIHEAVYRSDIIRICKILQRNPHCINDYNDDFQTPLYYFVANFNYNSPEQLESGLTLMKILLEHGADVNISCFNIYSQVEKATPLITASLNNQVDVVKFLLKNGADPNVHLPFYFEELFRAPISKDILELLLQYKVQINPLCRIYEHGSSDSALNACITNGQFDYIQLLVEHGVQSLNIYMVLLSICKNNEENEPDDSTLKYLLKHIKKIDAHKQFSPEALLSYIILTKHYNSHRDILKKNCFVLQWICKQNIKSNTGDSHLHQAVRENDKLKIEFLLQAGINVNEKNYFGDTPLHLLCRKFTKQKYFNDMKCHKIGRLLIKYGADVRAHNVIDETPFQLAARSREWSFVNFMLAKITEVDETTFNTDVSRVIFIPFTIGCYNNDSTMHELLAAIHFDYEQVINRLLEMDKYVNESSKNHRHSINTSLNIAIHGRQYSTIKKLLEAGFRTTPYFSDNIPLLRVVSDDKEDILRMVCLFWEFYDSPIINKAIIFGIYFTIQPPTADYIPMKIPILYLLIFLYAIYIRVDKLHKDLVPVKGLFKLHSHPVLTEILEECNKKLDELKEIKVGKVCIKNMMTMQLDLLVKLLNDKRYFDACNRLHLSLIEKKELEYYEVAIKTRLELAIEKRTIVNLATDRLNKALQHIFSPMDLTSFPDEIWWNIFSYLNVRQLKKLADLLEV